MNSIVVGMTSAWVPIVVVVQDDGTSDSGRHLGWKLVIQDGDRKQEFRHLAGPPQQGPIPWMTSFRVPPS